MPTYGAENRYADGIKYIIEISGCYLLFVSQKLNKVDNKK